MTAQSRKRWRVLGAVLLVCAGFVPAGHMLLEWRGLRLIESSSVFDLDCGDGGPGCTCYGDFGCQEGLLCRHGLCFGEDVPMPDTYYYDPRAREDIAAVRKQIARLDLVGEGAKVADIGSGRGALEVLLGPRLGPDGVIYATDMDPLGLTDTRRSWEQLPRAQAPHLESVLVDGPQDTGLDHLPEGSLDAVYVINSARFLHADDPAEARGYASRLVRLLRPGGAFVYCRDWVDESYLSPPEVDLLLTSAGLAPGYEVLPHLAHVPETTWVLQRILGLRMKTYQRGWALVFRKPGAAQ